MTGNAYKKRNAFEMDLGSDSVGKNPFAKLRSAKMTKAKTNLHVRICLSFSHFRTPEN
jgi:hypothetical protein